MKILELANSLCMMHKTNNNLLNKYKLCIKYKTHYNQKKEFTKALNVQIKVVF